MKYIDKSVSQRLDAANETIDDHQECFHERFCWFEKLHKTFLIIPRIKMTRGTWRIVTIAWIMLPVPG